GCYLPRVPRGLPTKRRKEYRDSIDPSRRLNHRCSHLLKELSSSCFPRPSIGICPAPRSVHKDGPIPPPPNGSDREDRPPARESADLPGAQGVSRIYQHPWICRFHCPPR